MYGACRVVGVGPSIVLDGRRYRTRAKTIRHYAEAEAEMLRMRGNPFDWLRGRDEAFVAAAFTQIEEQFSRVTITEYRRWAESWEGRCLTLWQAVRTRGMSYERLVRLVESECDATSPDEFWGLIDLALDQANGDDELGSLEWLYAASDEKAGSDSINWPFVVRCLCEEPFSFTVRDIFRMTLRQFNHFCCKRESLKDEMEFESIKDAQAYQAQQKPRRERAIRNLTEGKRWDSL